MTAEANVRSILSSEFGVNAEILDADAPIFSSGLLDSLSSLRLLMSLEQHFGFSVSPLDVSLEDVDSIGKITETIERLQS